MENYHLLNVKMGNVSVRMHLFEMSSVVVNFKIKIRHVSFGNRLFLFGNI